MKNNDNKNRRGIDNPLEIIRTVGWKCVHRERERAPGEHISVGDRNKL